MFYGCKMLSSLPDISNWNISKGTKLTSIFKGCNKKLKIPKKFKEYSLI